MLWYMNIFKWTVLQKLDVKNLYFEYQISYHFISMYFYTNL